MFNMFDELTKGQRWALSTLLTRGMNHTSDVLNDMAFECVYDGRSWNDHISLSEVWHEGLVLLQDLFFAGVSE